MVVNCFNCLKLVEFLQLRFGTTSSSDMINSVVIDETQTDKIIGLGNEGSFSVSVTGTDADITVEIKDENGNAVSSFALLQSELKI